MPPIRIRPAEPADLPALAELALALARMHAAIDRRRFAVPEGAARTYIEFFSGELERPEVVLLVAADGPALVGYAFIRREPPSLEALLESSTWLHDVYVDPPFRGRGIGRELVTEAINAAKRLGSSTLMLGVTPTNTRARRFYHRLGMRSTMIEMRLDLD